MSKVVYYVDGTKPRYSVEVMTGPSDWPEWERVGTWDNLETATLSAQGHAETQETHVRVIDLWTEG